MNTSTSRINQRNAHLLSGHINLISEHAVQCIRCTTTLIKLKYYSFQFHAALQPEVTLAYIRRLMMPLLQDLNAGCGCCTSDAMTSLCQTSGPCAVKKMM